jgi:hypothetical protein
LVLIIVNSPDSWVRISCEIMIFALIMMSMIRVLRRA